MRVVEVEIQWRARLHGRSSLTPIRLVAAGARIILAMIVVPLRSTVRSIRD
jgi:hypothetical protein